MRKSKVLQLFASEVEEELIKGGTSLVREVCRHITGSNPKIASFMVAKVVEWRYPEKGDGSNQSPLGLGFDESASDQSSSVC